ISQARGWIVAGLLLASCAWLAPSSARAGCAHDIATGSEAEGSGLAHFDRLDSAGALAGDSRRLTPTEPSPTPTCPGFRCSRDVPAPLTAPRTLPRIDAWGCFQLSWAALGTHSSPFPPDDDSPRPLDRAERLARPPR